MAATDGCSADPQAAVATKQARRAGVVDLGRGQLGDRVRARPGCRRRRRGARPSSGSTASSPRSRPRPRCRAARPTGTISAFRFDASQPAPGSPWMNDVASPATIGLVLKRTSYLAIGSSLGGTTKRSCPTGASASGPRPASAVELRRRLGRRVVLAESWSRTSTCMRSRPSAQAQAIGPAAGRAGRVVGDRAVHRVQHGPRRRRARRRSRTPTGVVVDEGACRPERERHAEHHRRLAAIRVAGSRSPTRPTRLAGASGACPR